MAENWDIENWKFEPYDHGLYPAVPENHTSNHNREMSSVWIRDNYWIFQATKEENIVEGYSHILRKHFSNIMDTINAEDPEDYHHIHPRYDKDLSEINEPWGWVQWDALGNMLEVFSYADSRQEFGDYAWEKDVMARYLSSFDVARTPDNGMWEEEKKIHPGSLASVVQGWLEYGKNLDDPEVMKLRKQIARHLPRKDLETVNCLYPFDFIGEGLKQVQIDYLLQLERGKGTIRYPGDGWNGVDRSENEEPVWPIGLGYLFLITGEPTYWIRLYELKQEHGYLPESFVDGEPNINQPLLWSEAMYQLASKKAEIKSEDNKVL